MSNNINIYKIINIIINNKYISTLSWQNLQNWVENEHITWASLIDNVEDNPRTRLKKGNMKKYVVGDLGPWQIPPPLNKGDLEIEQ